MNKATKLLMSISVFSMLFAVSALAQDPTDAPPAPTQDEANVISLFSDAYTDVTVDTWRTSWSAATFKDTTIAGNAVKRYTSLDFVGIETVANQIDISGMTHVNFDLWTPNATTFRIKIVDFGADAAFGGGDDVEHEVAFESVAQGEWTTYSISLASMTGLTTQGNISQIIFSGLPTGGVTAFIDNLFFSDEGVINMVDARALDLGTEVTVEGVLTTPDFNFFNNQFFMQDATAGISVYIDGDDAVGTNSDGNSPFAAGDIVRVTGTLIDTNGLLQVESDSTKYTILSSGNALPAPVTITEADISLDSKYQGMRVTLSTAAMLADGETWPEDAQTSSGVNVDVVAGDSTFTMRIDRDESFYDGAPAPTEKFQLSGNLGAFFSPQIFPFIEGDVRNAYKVNFTVNTATHPDTLMEDHFIQLRGAINGSTGAYFGGQVIDWNSSSTFVAENQGGDYWSIDSYMLDGDALTYKVWSGYDANTGSNNGDGGWEITGPDRPTRSFTVSADTMVTLWSESLSAPFETNADSVSLFFRVNVGAFVQDGSFDPANDKVGIRGNDQVFMNPSDWSSTAIYLSKEERVAADGTPIEDDNLFYSGTVLVDNEAADTLGSLPYKFVLETGSGVLWDNKDGNQDGNRFIDIPASDTTVHWVNFQGKAPTNAQIVTANVTFEVSTAVLEVLGYFDSGIGDKVVVRGEPPLDWGTSDFNTATFDDQDVLWRLTQEFTKAVGSSFKYKYFIEYDASRSDASSDNYIEAVAESGDFGYEEPVTTGGADRFFDFSDEVTQTKGVQYFNDVNTGAIIQAGNTPNGTMSVTFRIDMTAALTADVPFRPGTDSLYMQLESKFTALTNGFRSGGGYFDDITANGTAADIEFLRYTPVDGEDNIYELTLDLDLTSGTLNDFGYVVRYGEPFSDYESMVVNGGGFAAGRRFYQFVDPLSVVNLGNDPFLGEVLQSQWPETFTMKTVAWAESDLEFDVQPDYAGLATSSDLEPVKPEAFSLYQNYPNPFNPSTNISFTLPNAADVRLTVYNVLGQEVSTLINGKTLNSGTHTVAFDASALSSGMYIYRIEAGNFTSTKRMMLIK